MGVFTPILPFRIIKIYFKYKPIKIFYSTYKYSFLDTYELLMQFLGVEIQKSDFRLY